MSCTLQFKRGDKSRLPTLATGEPGWVTDEKKLYVGTGSENVGLASEADLAQHASDAQAHKALLADKADLVDGKVKSDQLPPIKTDQVVEQTTTPTSPDTILWVDPDEETPGVDIEGIRAEAELAHTTADSAITRLNGVDEQLQRIDNETGQIQTDLDEVNTRSLENQEAIAKIKPSLSAYTLATTVAGAGFTILNGGRAILFNSILYVNLLVNNAGAHQKNDTIVALTFTSPSGKSYPGSLTFDVPWHDNNYDPKIDYVPVRVTAAAQSNGTTVVTIACNDSMPNDGRTLDFNFMLPVLMEV